MKNKYPHFISTKPEGEDLSVGKSQKILGDAIAQHIKDIDQDETSKMPHMIGLEGTWGSGKSNVISYLKKSLEKDNIYHFFEYDAWSRQEDLCPKSILQLLVNDLINNELLLDITKAQIDVPNKSGEFKREEKSVSWKRRLDLLLSKKKKTISKRKRNVYPEFKWFMLVLATTPILISIMNACKPAGVCPACWALLVLLVACLPIFLFELSMWLHNKKINTSSNEEKYSWERVFEIYLDYNMVDENAYDIINESEPSQVDFSDWMRDISEALAATGHKLVIVIDNMDRLPKEKVKQLWSIIHLLIPENNLRNIWCIIPYDFVHLSSAFGEKESEDEIKITKLFIEKSFPVTYRVPQPIIADYKGLLNNFILQAFGDTESKSDLAIVNRCYRKVHDEPNIRDMISFVNQMVSIRHQWKDIGIITIALYVLNQDEMFYMKKHKSLEEFILNQKYSNKFDYIVPETKIKDFAALVYGVNPEQAYQLVVKLLLQNAFSSDSNLQLNSIADSQQFFDILEEVVKDADFENYKKLITKLDQLDAKYESSVAHLWLHIAKTYVKQAYDLQKYSQIDHSLLIHIDSRMQSEVMKKICSELLKPTKIQGNIIYQSLHELFNEPFAKGVNIQNICQPVILDPTRYIEYVREGQNDYTAFPIKADSQKLNEYIISSFTDGSQNNFTSIIHTLKDDPDYDFKSVGDKAIELLPNYITQGPIVYKLISVLRELNVDVKNTLRKYDTTRPWMGVKDTASEDEKIEFYLLYIIGGQDINGEPIPQGMNITELARRALFYRSSTEMLTMTSQNISAPVRGITACMINEKIHDANPNFSRFLAYWKDLKGYCSLANYHVLYDFAKSWGYNSIPEGERVADILQLIPDVKIFEEGIGYDSNLAHEIVGLVKDSLYKQPTSAILSEQNLQRGVMTYWKVVFNTLVSVSMIERKIEWCQNIASEIIHRIAIGHQYADDILENFVNAFTYRDLSSKFIDIRDKMLRGEPNYVMNKYKFIKLHTWLEKSQINSRDRRDDAATRIIAKVVEDTECQNIMLGNKSFYQTLFADTIETASDLQNKVHTIRQNQAGEFVDWLNEIYTPIEAQAESEEA